MLKGLIIAASKADELKHRLTAERLLWTELQEPKKRKKEDFLAALKCLSAEEKEVLCLVETDRDERTALELGLFVIGYLNPDCPGEQLSGCKLLLEGYQEIDRLFLENVHTRALGLPVQIAGTKRLLIREMTLEDLDAVRSLYQEEHFLFQTSEHPLNREEEEEKIKAYIHYMYGLYQFGMWVVIERESGKLIGRAGFGIADYLDFSEVDLGYLIGKEYRRRGYAEEACRAVLDYAGRILDLPGVSAYIDQENEASLRLIEKLGFQKKEDFIYQGRRLGRYCIKFT